MKWLPGILFCSFILFLVLFAASQPQWTTAQATVSDVRMTFESRNIESHQNNVQDNVITDAVIGYMIGNKTGAVIGAVAGSGSSPEEKETNEEIVACRVKAILPSGKILTFTLSRKGYGDNSELLKASTLKDNDTIYIGVLGNPPRDYYWKVGEHQCVDPDP